MPDPRKAHTLEAIDQTENTILVVTIDGKPWRFDASGVDYLCGSCGFLVVVGVPTDAALISGGILCIRCTKCGADNRVPSIPAQAHKRV